MEMGSKALAVVNQGSKQRYNLGGRWNRPLRHLKHACGGEHTSFCCYRRFQWGRKAGLGRCANQLEQRVYPAGKRRRRLQLTERDGRWEQPQGRGGR